MIEISITLCEYDFCENATYEFEFKDEILGLAQIVKNGNDSYKVSLIPDKPIENISSELFSSYIVIVDEFEEEPRYLSLWFGNTNLQVIINESLYYHDKVNEFILIDNAKGSHKSDNILVKQADGKD